MYNTFNMGLGMVIALDPADVDKAMAAIKEAGDECYVVGTSIFNILKCFYINSSWLNQSFTKCFTKFIKICWINA